MVCQGLVPVGEGTLRKEGDDWGVIHADFGGCPKGSRDNGSIRHGYARAFTQRMFAMLRRDNLTHAEITEAVNGLAALAQTGWTNRETCESVLLNSVALKGLERWEVEDLLAQLQPQESNA